MSERELHDLARRAGIRVAWRDVSGNENIVSNESLAAILAAIGLRAETASQIRESADFLKRDMKAATPRLLTAGVGEPIDCPIYNGKFKIKFEGGGILEGELSEQATLPAIFDPGYHQLEVSGHEVQLAVAPKVSYTLSDVTGGRKIWGLAVQLYALRRHNDGGIGDFTALAALVRAAALHGANAVAISPVHAQFSADLTRFGPYSPSNRAALNVLHISEETDFSCEGDFVDWEGAGAAKLNAFRRSFARFDEHDALSAFRQEAGLRVERHAIFEAIQATLKDISGVTADWRTWPAGLQNPESSEVLAFVAAHALEIEFQTYLQFRADKELRAANQAARDAGMMIGLIADLAVGTDQRGSHSWSRQSEVLGGVEIGAPPDEINREGQSWGITAFSPRGLRNSGFSAFIEMLRHALRHAGGLRIDHVMGLARLWIIPQGRPSAHGAYLAMPLNDLMRLVRLESHRHKAVILGEDLGTLPDGFQLTLDEAGISGLRVLWFEKHGAKFKQPVSWSKTAVAVTSTHDLPTVAGWWRGQDIGWRERLGMAGDHMDMRNEERLELWSAMVEAGAADGSMPACDDADTIVDAACGFLGSTASTLALLPIEDALAVPEQPNLPGTVDEHPNWRRRLPDDSAAILNGPKVAARLAKLNNARNL